MNDGSSSKITLILLGTAIAFLGLVIRLYYLQVVKGEFYLIRSESNFIQERPIKHSRGKILDHYGRVLVDNRLAYDLFLTFAMLPDSKRALRSAFAPLQLTRVEIQEIEHEISLRLKAGVTASFPLRDGVPYKTCEKIVDSVRQHMVAGLEINFDEHDFERGCSLEIDPVEFPSQMLAYQRLLGLLANKKDFFSDAWDTVQRKSQGLARFRPTLFISDIGYDAYAKIENAIALGKLPGVSVMPAKRRRYINGEFATHVLGYVNQVSLDDIKKRPTIYKPGDSLGRHGVEATFEDYLRGQDGIERVVVDAKGRRFDEAWEFELLGKERIVDPSPGTNIRLAIDFELQKAAEDYFLEKSGSVIVMDVNTGFIRAMASFPSFDPNVIVSADNAKVMTSLLKDPSRPFRAKFIQDHYSPGSIFKSVTAIAGMSKRLISRNSTHYCSGNYRIHKTTWRCFKREGHGPIALDNALKVSCDSYFYELGHRLGLGSLAEVAFKLGFGEKTGIDLFGEIKGIVPNPAYYKKRLGYVAPGFVVNMSIGQGDLAVTPIQLAVAYAAIANGGNVLKPQLIEEIFDERGVSIKKFTTEKRKGLLEDGLDGAAILNGLANVTDPGGSAHGLRYRSDFSDIGQWLKEGNISIVGKTGTAQVVKLSKTVDHVDPKDVPYEHRDHAWFVGVYPKEKPEIVVVVMSEHGGFGGSTSAPVAVRLMKKWQEGRDAELAHSMRASYE